MEGQWIDISVPEHKEKERIDAFLTREISQVSRSQIQRLVKAGYITVNGVAVKANHVLRPMEAIRVFIPRARPIEVVAENIPLEIVFEDDHLIVINKKAGMVVHPAFGHSSGTLVNALLGYSKTLSTVNTATRPGIVHRIDKDTSGLLVVAKSNFVHQHLANQFSKKTVERMYIALVWGQPKPATGTIETLLARSQKDRKKIRVSPEGKQAVTHYEVMERYPLTALMRLQLETGRTHQIRVHLAHIHHPVFGDHTYGGRGRQTGGLNRSDTALAMELLKMMPRQALHAKTLGFIHPVSGKAVSFDSDLPEDMERLISRLAEAKREIWG